MIHRKKVRSKPASVSINSGTELSEIVFPVRIVNFVNVPPRFEFMSRIVHVRALRKKLLYERSRTIGVPKIIMNFTGNFNISTKYWTTDSRIHKILDHRGPLQRCFPKKLFVRMQQVHRRISVLLELF